MDAPRHRDDEGDHSGDHQEADLDPVAGIEVQSADFAAGGPARHQDADQNDDRPPETHQQPIRAGHVRRRVLRVSGRVAGGVGVVQVDGVLGKDGDDGQHGDGQAARDVDLGGFRSPRQHKAGAHDGATVDEQTQHRLRVHTEDSQHQSGEDDDADDCE